MHYMQWKHHLVKQVRTLSTVLHALFFQESFITLSEFATYNSTLERTKQLGFVNLNGCYWCCY